MSSFFNMFLLNYAQFFCSLCFQIPQPGGANDSEIVLYQPDRDTWIAIVFILIVVNLARH